MNGPVSLEYPEATQARLRGSTRRRFGNGICSARTSFLARSGSFSVCLALTGPMVSDSGPWHRLCVYKSLCSKTLSPAVNLTLICRVLPVTWYQVSQWVPSRSPLCHLILFGVLRRPPTRSKVVQMKMAVVHPSGILFARSPVRLLEAGQVRSHATHTTELMKTSLY